jgi:putative transposase
VRVSATPLQSVLRVIDQSLIGHAGRRCGRARLLRARRAAGPGLSERIPCGTAEDGGRRDGIFAPQIAGRDEPFRSAIRDHLKGHTQGLEDLAIEMLARGLSVRDIEDAFKDEDGRLLLSKTAVSQLGERLWEDYQAFAQRDLSEDEIAYLFVDGIAERLRPGAKREPVLTAWGFTAEGRRVLLHLMAGSKEDAETVTAFFEDMKRPGLNDPLLVTSDGAPGIIKAIEVCFPRAARQRCLAHRMRNLAAKLPEDVWPEFKVRVQAAYQAPSRAIARERATSPSCCPCTPALKGWRVRSPRAIPMITYARRPLGTSVTCERCSRRSLPSCSVATLWWGAEVIGVAAALR